MSYLYVGLGLDGKSRRRLEKWFLQCVHCNMRSKTNAFDEYRLYCHHMTIAVPSNMDVETYSYCLLNKGKQFKITAIALGVSDKAIAVKVQTECPSKNEIKHITIATSTINRGKPVDSNNIIDWVKIKKIELYGTLRFFEP